MAEATGLDEVASPPGACRSRHDCHTIYERICSAVEIKAGDIFDGLPVCDEVFAIANLGIARGCADAGITEVAQNERNEIRLEDCIGIHGNDDLATCQLNPQVQGARLPPVLFGD